MSEDNLPPVTITSEQLKYLQDHGHNINDPEVQRSIRTAQRPPREVHPKSRRRIIAYTDNHYGMTACTSCAKRDSSWNPSINPFISTLRNTEVDTTPGGFGDLIVCTANCGKNIIGRNEDFQGYGGYR